MAPNFPFRTPSPSNFSLSLALPPSYPNTAPPSPRHSPLPVTSQASYFPSMAPPSHPSKEEAVKTVKAVEEVLLALNEYRVTAAAWGKAGKKLAGSLEKLVSGLKKTEVAAQTMRPAAAMLDDLSVHVMKLSKRIDKAYEDANDSVSKYVNLLAKEHRSHEAYLSAISKKHEKAEKAYKKASKNLSDASGAHEGFLKLKETLGQDISRASADHSGWIGQKQSMVLLKVAASTGSLAGNLLSFFSEGMKDSGSSYKNIEYFRILAEIQWHGALPSELVEQNEEKRREELRLIKAAVAVGEVDLIGQEVWERLQHTRTPLHSISAYAPQQARDALSRRDEAPSRTKPSINQLPLTVDRAPNGALPISSPSKHQIPNMLDTPHQNSVSRPSTSSTGPPQSPVSNSPPDIWEQEGSVRIRQEAPDVATRGLPYRVTSTAFATQPARPLPIPVPRHSSYSGTTALQRSVSHMAAELERKTAQERQDISRGHHSHKVLVRGCELCISGTPARPVINHQGQKRSVTMPPVYTSIPSSPVTSPYRINQDRAKTGHGTSRDEFGVSLSSPPVTRDQGALRSSYHVPSSALRTGAVVLGPRVRGGRHSQRGEGE